MSRSSDFSTQASLPLGKLCEAAVAKKERKSPAAEEGQA